MTQTPVPLAEPAPAVRYRIVGPQTWALVREDYLSGVPARVCAARHGVTESNLKRRAREEGWTRRDHAARLEAQWTPGDRAPDAPASEPEPPSDPKAAVSQAIQQAERLMSRGEGQKALQTLRAAETYVETLERTAARRILTPEEEEAAERARQAASDARDREVWDRARSIRGSMSWTVTSCRTCFSFDIRT
jgi:hypothetical protein